MHHECTHCIGTWAEKAELPVCHVREKAILSAVAHFLFRYDTVGFACVSVPCMCEHDTSGVLCMTLGLLPELSFSPAENVQYTMHARTA